MKRELKGALSDFKASPGAYRKAHPDEKGTERNFYLLHLAWKRDRKAHPDEKGTERSRSWAGSREIMKDRKAHPDEKGTESLHLVRRY